MQEETKVIVGVDIGTSNTKVVVANFKNDNPPVITGVSKVATSGVRKGVIDNLNSVAKAVDQALGEAERKAGVEIKQATFNVNGSSIISSEVDGMIALSGAEVASEDLMRIEDVATVGKIPANRDILSVIPYDYVLDGQTGIKDPIGMVGSRLEIKANIVSALTPNIQNLNNACELAEVHVDNMVVSSVAAAKAVLSEQQLENGVAVIDFGSATTGVAIYEEGDLRYTAVIPYGSHNITNDLAIGLKTTPEVSEEVKLVHGNAIDKDTDKQVAVKVDKKTYEFNLRDIGEIIEARLDEIFELVVEKIKESGYYGKLPNGVVLVGGGAKLKNLAKFVENKVELSVSLAKKPDLGGLIEEVDDLEFMTALGLMLIDQEEPTTGKYNSRDGESLFSKFMRFFKK